MSTSTRVLCLLPALWPIIALGEPSEPTGPSCPVSSGKNIVPAQMAAIPPGEKTLSLILEARDDDGKPISDQKEVMEWVRLCLSLAGTPPDSITIFPEATRGVRVQLRGETMQQADDLEAYLCCPDPFWILPVHPCRDSLLADRDPATDIMRNMHADARIMLQTNPNEKLASAIVVQTDMADLRFIKNTHLYDGHILKITTQPNIYGDNITIITLCPVHRYWSPPPIVLCSFPHEPEINWIVPYSPFTHDTPTTCNIPSASTECRLCMHGELRPEDCMISKADIAKARIDEQDPHRILIILTPAGRAKLQQYMATMKPGQDRLAIVMNGCIIATPFMKSSSDTELSFSLDTPQRAKQTAQWLSAKNIHLTRSVHQKNIQATTTAE